MLDDSSMVIDCFGSDLNSLQKTKTGVIISKQTIIQNSVNIYLGKVIIGANCVLRGDLGTIHAFDFVFIADKVTLHPSISKQKKY